MVDRDIGRDVANVVLVVRHLGLNNDNFLPNALVYFDM